jgi:hypothetical protein
MYWARVFHIPHEKLALFIADIRYLLLADYAEEGQ